MKLADTAFLLGRAVMWEAGYITLGWVLVFPIRVMKITAGNARRMLLSIQFYLPENLASAVILLRYPAKRETMDQH